MHTWGESVKKKLIKKILCLTFELSLRFFFCFATHTDDAVKYLWLFELDDMEIQINLPSHLVWIVWVRIKTNISISAKLKKYRSRKALTHRVKIIKAPFFTDITSKLSLAYFLFTSTQYFKNGNKKTERKLFETARIISSRVKKNIVIMCG